MAAGLVVAATALLALPAAGLAADSYVDRGDGSNAGGNTCHDKAHPCFSIARGLAEAGDHDTVFVGGDPLPYTTPQTLNDGKSLVHSNFSTTPGVDTSGPAVLDTGSKSSPAITVSAAAGQITGFTIRSATLPLKIEGSVNVFDDRFDESQQIPEEIDATGPHVNATTVKNCVFVDPTPLTGIGSEQAAIYVEPGTDNGLHVKESRFEGFQVSILVLGGYVLIQSDKITGTHSANGFGDGVLIQGKGGAFMRHDVLRDPDTSSGTVDGVDIGASGLASGLERNRIEGFQDGVSITDEPHSVHLADDVFLDNAFSGVAVVNSAPATRKVLLENETFWDPGASQGDIDLVDAAARLDSTIVGPAGVTDAFDDSACSIHHSRGPRMHAGGDGCRNFQTTRGPRFRADGYHLSGKSPLIDRGTPGKAPRELDIDGQKRVLPGDCRKRHAKPRRDIGADEFKCKR